jgi:two-component system NtrC family sensor kinase
VKTRLAVRMGIALALGAAAILVLAGAWNLHLQRAHLTQVVGLSADRVAETIRASTRDAMKRNDSDGLHRVIDNLGAQPGVVRIRVFNKEGRIRTSTDPPEVGTLVDTRAEQCVACHAGGQPLDRLERTDRVRTFRGRDGQRVLGVIAPIHNEAQCHSCHPARQRVLGVLDVQLSMATVEDALVASEWQMAGGLATTVGAMVVLFASLMWGLVLKPVRRLTRAMNAVSQGDLRTRVPITSSDEIGGLAMSWNAMTDELLRSRSELTRWNQALEERVEEKTAELRTAHERMVLVEKMASLGKLAAVVAHEVNNPLAGIRTFARLLRRRLGDHAPEEQVREEHAEAGRILETIDSEAGRCGDIVRNLLLFSRASAARFAQQDLGAIVDRCQLLLRHQAVLQGVTLEIGTEAGLLAVCDGAQVQQMLLALAMNGLEACPTGGQVTITAAREGTGFVLRVSDTGSGIAAEDKPHIFEPFFTTKESGKGVGLGLAVVYGIVSRHRGRIDVDSKVGSGTTFSIHLPPLPPGEAAPEESEAAP